MVGVGEGEGEGLGGRAKQGAIEHSGVGTCMQSGVGWVSARGWAGGRVSDRQPSHSVKGIGGKWFERCVCGSVLDTVGSRLHAGGTWLVSFASACNC